MVEGGVAKANKAEFMECFKMSWRQPYILRLALSAGIGGFLFGYDTGVISGALLYIRDDFTAVDKSTFLQEAIVAMAVVGAIFGAAIGGWMNDALGRKKSILIADFLFFVGAAIMAIGIWPWLIIVGRIFVGFGVGMASMTAPLYISEASPARIRGALVSTNGLLITGGQFLSYLINLAFTRVKGTWRWMLGIAGLPAAIQFILMLSLPESPRWLYRKGKHVEAVEILRKIYPDHEVEGEIDALKKSIEDEIAEEGSIGGDSFFAKVQSAWNTPIVRRGLVIGIGCQVAQQFVGINTVMYYSPTIIQLAGIASNQAAIALSLGTSGLNAIGSIISIAFVDRFGRRRMMIVSMIFIIAFLFGLTVVFKVASENSPLVTGLETNHFGNNTCPAYLTAPNVGSWDCVKCLQASAGCGFCANKADLHNPGACLISNPAGGLACKGEKRTWYTKGCPSGWYAYLAIVMLILYIIAYSPGMGTVPWIVNSEIYPLRYRGVCGGLAAVSNWTSNFIVSMSFLSLTKALGSSYTFMLFGLISCVSLVFIVLLVPETKGLQFEEVEKMLAEKGWIVWRKKRSQETVKSAT